MAELQNTQATAVVTQTLVMDKGNEVYVSADGKHWYKAVYVEKSANGRYYVEGYDRGLSFCKTNLNEDDVFKGVFNHCEVFWI